MKKENLNHANSSRYLEDKLEEEPHTVNGDEDEDKYTGKDVDCETGSWNKEKVTNSSQNFEQELEEPHTVNGEEEVRWHGSPWEEIEH